MTATLTHFLLPADIDAAGAEAAIGGIAEPEVPSSARVTFFDSFDWRVFDDGAVLELMEEAKQGGTAGRLSLTWRNRETGASRGRFSLARPPRFATDLPDSPAAARLAKVLEMRALLALISVETARRSYRMLNEDGKTVLRLRLEEDMAHNVDTGAKQPLGRRVVLAPVRGYPGAFDDAAARLTEALGMRPLKGHVLTHALAAFGRRPGDYSSKLRLSFAPEMRADQAARLVHLSLLETMRRNEGGVVADTDSEFLHDFRVAIRRTRSALAQLKRVFPPDATERFSADFRWLGQITSPLRDLDVFLLDLPAMRDAVGPDLAPALDPFAAHLRARHAAEHKAVVRALRSKRYAKIVADWHAFLTAPPGASGPEATLGKNADRPIGAVAGSRIWSLYKKAVAEGRAIPGETPDEALHELRKTAKRLRYMMEFFQSLYPQEEVKALIKVLKQMQEILGTFQDGSVQSQALTAMAQDMHAQGKAPAQTYLALGRLTGHLAQRKAEARAAFAARFAAFADADVRDRFARLFKTGAKAAA